MSLGHVYILLLLMAALINYLTLLWVRTNFFPEYLNVVIQNLIMKLIGFEAWKRKGQLYGLSWKISKWRMELLDYLIKLGRNNFMSVYLNLCSQTCFCIYLKRNWLVMLIDYKDNTMMVLFSYRFRFISCYGCLWSWFQT